MNSNETSYKTTVTVVIVALLIIGIGYAAYRSNIFGNIPQPVPRVLSFEDCAAAGYPVMESYPRQCKTPDGRTYTEELPGKITYTNASSSLIQVALPFPNAVVGKEFSVIGKARGVWFFEASFPIDVIDKDGKLLAQGFAQAQGEWMTEDFVPFKGDIKVPETYIGAATLILRKDNPSALPEHDASISFPITIEY